MTERGKLLSTQAGVYKCEKHRCDLFFVTLEKDEKEFTPTSSTGITPFRRRCSTGSRRSREDSETGRRYPRSDDAFPVLLGPVRYAGHEGERPMSITWRLDRAVPGDWFQQVKVAAG